LSRFTSLPATMTVSTFPAIGGAKRQDGGGAEGAIPRLRQGLARFGVEAAGSDPADELRKAEHVIRGCAAGPAVVGARGY
jgi:hypothetical protein